jgi:hypothetical protein
MEAQGYSQRVFSPFRRFSVVTDIGLLTDQYEKLTGISADASLKDVCNVM